MSWKLSLAKTGLLQKSANAANQKLSAQSSQPVPLPSQQTLSLIKDLNMKLDLIDHAQANKFVVSEKIVNEIISKKMPDIKITEIFYQNDATAGKKVSINGLAVNRERLLLFRQILEADPLFEKVDLPISNFIKGSNLQFSLSLKSS